MDERLVKAARDGDVNTLLNLLEEDPQILQKASSFHFAYSPLHVAALSGTADFVKQIVTRNPSLATQTNQQGMIPLHLASLEGHVDTVRELLKAKLDDDDGGDGVNHQCLVNDEEGWNPLHCASQRGKISVIQELISSCPECLEQVTAKGETVLHLAVKSNQFGAVKLLADSSRHHNFYTLFKAQDQKGKRAYQLAEAKKQFQVVEILKEDGEVDYEIRKERRINVEESESEACKREERDKELMKLREAVAVVATLIITLTYQALVNPPSTFLKDGSPTIQWGCLKKGASQGLIKHLKDCPALLALLFMIFNSMIFYTSVFVVAANLRGPSVFHVRLLTLMLILCYSCLLTAFNNYAVYFAFPYALLTILTFLFSNVDEDLAGPLVFDMFANRTQRAVQWMRRLNQLLQRVPYPLRLF